MTWIAFILLLVSVFAHALWNLLGKRHNPSAAFFLVASIAATLCLVPLLIYYRQALAFIPGSVWSLVLATGVFQTIYYVGLAGAYRRGSMSLAYPLARAVPVLLVAGVSLTLGRANQLSSVGMTGIALVGIGCLMLPLHHFHAVKAENYLNACCLLALVAALGTSGYTLIDDEALRQLRTLPSSALNRAEITLLYISLETASTTLILGGYTLLHATERRYVKQIWGSARLPAVITGLIITATYGLVLASMNYVRDVSYVAAFRQLSIPLGALLGIAVQKEPRYRPKMVGTGVVFTGLVLVGLA